MSRLHDTGGRYGRWTNNLDLFINFNMCFGPKATWHRQELGGTSAYALLGPDINSPSAQQTNVPTATGIGWNRNWRHRVSPPVPFTRDHNIAWIRGHLINGRWGGPGHDWQNLTPLTSVANHNHATIEAGIDRYLIAFKQFEDRSSPHPSHWYGVRYFVQISTEPWAEAAFDPGDNLYGYAPNFIKVSWSIIRITKPTINANATLNDVRRNLPIWFEQQERAMTRGDPNSSMRFATPADMAQDFPTLTPLQIPQVLPNSQDNINELSGGIPGVQPIPANAPPLQFPNLAYNGQAFVMQS